MEDKNYDVLKLENQLCFPLYAAAKEIVRKYTPFLDELGLTYTQYITLMVLWEDGRVSVKRLGERLFLDSGTLTPLLKTMESKGLIVRSRNLTDQRIVEVSLTDKGTALKDKAVGIPLKLASCVPLTPDEAKTLLSALNKILTQ